MGEDQRHIARYSLVLKREPASIIERHLIKKRLEKLVEDVITDDLDNDCVHSFDSRSNLTQYTFNQGMAYVNLTTNLPTLIVFEDTFQEWSKFTAGGVTAHMLNALDIAFRDDVFIFYSQGSKLYRIRDLAEVRVTGTSNGHSEFFGVSAIPVHHKNRQRMRSSSLAIKQAEDYVRSRFGKNHNGKISIETRTANVWEINHGILHGFTDEETPDTGPHLYRRRNIMVAGGKRTEPNPRSDGPQSS